MSTPLKFYIDIQARRLVLGPSSTVSASAPIMRQGETVQFELYFLDPTGGTGSNPYPSYYTPAGLTMKVGIMKGLPTGGADTLDAYQDTWTPITNGYAASVAFNTTQIATDLGSSSSMQCTMEVEVTEPASTPVKLVQASLTIQAAVIDTGSTSPTPSSSYYTKTEVDAGFLHSSPTAGQGITLKSPDGTKTLTLYCGNDGSLLTVNA